MLTPPRRSQVLAGGGEVERPRLPTGSESRASHARMTVPASPHEYSPPRAAAAAATAAGRSAAAAGVARAGRRGGRRDGAVEIAADAAGETGRIAGPVGIGAVPAGRRRGHAGGGE